jgi:hypothetical protein
MKPEELKPEEASDRDVVEVDMVTGELVDISDRVERRFKHYISKNSDKRLKYWQAIQTGNSILIILHFG